MWTQDAKDLVSQISSAVVYVEVLTTAGNIGTGSAFHIGGGFFATARHVIEKNQICRVGRFDTSIKTHPLPGGGYSQTTTHCAFETSTIDKIYLHPADQVDAAIFKLAGDFEPTMQLDPSVDHLTEGEFLMQEVVVLGYPPIPFTNQASLVVFRGEVAAVVKHRVCGERHFVISGMARGGFSGGPVVKNSNPPAVLGLVSHALDDGKPFAELGFIAALSAKAVFETVDYFGLKIPAIQSTYYGFVA